MRGEYWIIVIIGVVLFLHSYSMRDSYFDAALNWILGIVLVYLGLKLNEEEKKKEQ